MTGGAARTKTRKSRLKVSPVSDIVIFSPHTFHCFDTLTDVIVYHIWNIASGLEADYNKRFFIAADELLWIPAIQDVDKPVDQL